MKWKILHLAVATSIAFHLDAQIMVSRRSIIDTPDLKADINLMQTVYGIFLVLGFRGIADVIYDLLFGAHSGYHRSRVVLFFCGSLLTVGFRFFWAVGNIRRFVLRSDHATLEATRRFVTILYFPMLLCHALLFYILSRLVNVLSSGDEFESVVWQTLFVVGFFFSFNVAWLTLLIAPRLDELPESIWVWNNSSTVIGVAAFAGVGFYLRLQDTCVLWGLAVLVYLNSFFDLYRTASSYVGHPSRQ